MSMKIMSKEDLLDAIDHHIDNYNAIKDISNMDERVDLLDNLTDELMDYITIGKNKFSMSNEEIGEIYKRINNVKKEDSIESSHVR